VRRSSEGGSVLVLIPAVVLVLVILGAICVDSAITYLGHRQLQDFADSLAQQVATASLDQPAFYQQGAVALNPTVTSTGATVTSLVAQAEQVADDNGALHQLDATVSFSPDGKTVSVTATATVDDLFGPSVGGQRSVRIAATGSATLATVRITP
jgi:uncharacterized membrane protein